MWALPGRPELSLREHEAMMEAIRAGDAEATAQLMREHIQSGEETLT
jgi:DNA-binding GntR family transcriptional regulator